MNRMLIFPFMVLAISLLFGTATVADDDVMNALDIRYGDLKAAMSAHDSQALLAMLTPDFESIDISGKSTSGHDLASEIATIKADPNRVSTTTLTSVSREGDVARAEQRYDMQTMKVMSGTTHKIELITLSSDVWVYETDQWRMKSTITKEVSVFMDGRLVTHKVAR